MDDRKTGKVQNPHATVWISFSHLDVLIQKIARNQLDYSQTCSSHVKSKICQESSTITHLQVKVLSSHSSVYESNYNIYFDVYIFINIFYTILYKLSFTQFIVYY